MIETYVEKGMHQEILPLIHTSKLRRDRCRHILAFYVHLMIGVTFIVSYPPPLA